MRRRTYIYILLAALAPLALSAASTHAETGNFEVRKTKLRLKASDESDRPQDSLRLQASFLSLRSMNPEAGAISVTTGPEAVSSFPLPDSLADARTIFRAEDRSISFKGKIRD